METFKYIQEDDYITIPASLRKRGLKSAELIIAAIIFRYSLKDGSKFYGSIRYLCEWTGLTKRAVMLILQKLVKDGIIVKEETMIDLVKRCYYTYNFGGEKITPQVKKLHQYGEKITLGVEKKLHWGGEKITPNNINNNINIENNESIEESTHAQTEKKKSSSAKQKKDMVLDSNNRLAATADQASRYGRFMKWAAQTIPDCYATMAMPTEKQLATLMSTYGDSAVIDIFETIENRQDIRGKYKSLYLTAKNWLKRDEQKK